MAVRKGLSAILDDCLTYEQRAATDLRAYGVVNLGRCSS